MSELVLVRHGETEWASNGRHTGRTDVELTAAGRTQADQIAAKLGGRSFTRVWTSPLSRARETCERAKLSTASQTYDDLMEWDYGDYEGITTAEVRIDLPGWSVWTHPILGGESVDDVGRRADQAIARALRVDGDVCIFAHGHFLRIFAARWLGLPSEDGRLLALDTATVSTLGFERETQVVRGWNGGCHLVTET